MRSRKGLSHVITIFIGIVVGFILTILIGIFQYHIFGCERPLVGTATSGDIAISVLKASAFEEGIDDPNIDEVLGMKKKGKMFLMMFQDKAGNTIKLGLFDEKKHPILTMKSLSASGRWGNANYGGANEAGRLIGDNYTDINFDGNFDVKLVFDGTGKGVLRKEIYINGIWKQVERCNFRKAILDQTTYVFDSNTGWHEEVGGKNNK